MAIDKGLFQAPKKPTRSKLNVPAPQDAEALRVPLAEKAPIEVKPTEDGGAEIDFDPQAMAMEMGESQGNLAEVLEEDVLDPLGSEMLNSYEDYKASRDDWEQSYIKGLDLLGFKYEDRTEPFQGASGATHPVLAEAVTQFQSLAYKELLPANGPVRTRIIGKHTKEKEDQAERVKEFMNYQLMCEMPEYEPEVDQMLFNLPLAGSTFKKVYYDSVLGRCVSKFVPAEDLVVPYSATSLEEAESIMHVIKMTANELRKLQVGGFYRDIDLGTPAYHEDEVKEEKQDISGVSTTNKDEIFTLIECHVDLDLDGFQDMGKDGEPTGIKLPYIVTVEESSGEVLSIRKNYADNDPFKKRTEYFVHFKFLPGLGFYGFGLIHMIGGLSRTATAALRQLLDAGTLSNLPAGFKMRGIRIRDEAQPLQPGEFRDVDAPGGNLKDAFQMLPYKGPDGTLLSLMGTVVAAGQRFASIADMQVGDGNQSAAVGTTVALLERGSRVMSAIHKRLYAAMKKEFMLISNVFAAYLPPNYPYDVVGGQRQIKQTDFDQRIDVIPVADPNIFSQTQRITMAQTQLQMALSMPKMHNLYNAYRDMYEALGIKNIDAILPPPSPPQPMDPSVEHMMALSQKPFKAFPGQDHTAHMKAHISFMGTQLARTNPNILASIQKNILEHISLMAQEQVQLEFKEEMAQIKQMTAQMQQMGAINPQMMQQNPQMMQMTQQIKSLSEKIESRKAILVAETTAEYMQEEKKVLNQIDNDPLLRLKADEVQIRAREEQRRRDADEEKSNLDRLRLVQNRELAEEKMDENDKHQKLRAAVSLAKAGVKDMKAAVIEDE